ncbi:MAG: TraR/DksA C4-type zinc finger protein [Microthrixaceae bacterium]
MTIDELDGVMTNSPTHLSDEQLASLRSQLEAERAEYTEPLEDPSDEADLADDPGTRLSERQAFEEATVRHASQLEAIDHAIKRFDLGAYGTCEACGVEIPFERLDAVPDAVLCIDCQSKVTG